MAHNLLGQIREYLPRDKSRINSLDTCVVCSLGILDGPTPYALGSFCVSFFSASSSRCTYTSRCVNCRQVFILISTFKNTRKQQQHQLNSFLSSLEPNRISMTSPIKLIRKDHGLFSLDLSLDLYYWCCAVTFESNLPSFQGLVRFWLTYVSKAPFWALLTY